MTNEFSGQQATLISDTVKTVLRDYLSDKLRGEPYAGSLREWQGVDVKLADEMEEQDAPLGKPLVVIRTRKKTQESTRAQPDGIGTAPVKATLHRFDLDVRVICDRDSGSVANGSGISSGSLLSDYIDEIVRKLPNRMELRAKGVEVASTAERIEDGPDDKENGRQINTHIIPATAVTIDE